LAKRSKNAGSRGTGGAQGNGPDGHYGPSYINDSPNMQVVGFAEEGKHGHRARQQQARPTQAPSWQRMPAQPQMPVKPQRSRRRHGGAAKGFFRLLLTVIVICAIPIGAYCFMLDRALAMDPGERAAVNEVLTPSMPGKPYYVLLLGSDSRDAGSAESGRSDVIMLMRIDALGDQVTMVTIPRDTPYRTSDGTLIKINEAYAQGGPAFAAQAVSATAGVPIAHVVSLGFSDLEAIVDALGGVTVDVDTALGYNDAITGDYVTVEPGTQVLDGQQAQIFARARHEYESQDAGRQSNVRTLVSACADSLMDRPLYTVPGTVLDVAEYVDTDMRSYDLAATFLPMAVRPGSTTVYTCAGPYDGDINAETGTWMCYEDPEAWASLMSAVDSGVDPNA
jgi:LCP family protein required for cell wall assembly